MDYKEALKVLDQAFFHAKGMHIIDDHGKWNGGVAKPFNNNSVNEEHDQKQDLVLKESVSEDQNFGLEYDQNTLTLYVPQSLQEQIRFSIEFIFSEFDKVNQAVCSLTDEFDANRAGVIKNAGKELLNAKQNYTELSRKKLIDAVVQLGNVIEDLAQSVSQKIETINDIPTSRKNRLFKTNIGLMLNTTRTARNEVLFYLNGVVTYVEIHMMIGEKTPAIRRVDDAISFLQSFGREQLERMEGWNKEKDHFWDVEYGQIVKQLEARREELSQYNENALRIVLEEME